MSREKSAFIFTQLQSEEICRCGYERPYMAGSGYWIMVEPVWTTINVYEGPEIFRTTFDSAPHRAALLFAAHFAQSEICNGGFHQFFWNSTGVLAPEAIDGMKAIGCCSLASVIETAMNQLVVPYIRERPRRQALLEALPKRYFDPLDEHFFKLIVADNGGFEAAADRFALETECP